MSPLFRLALAAAAGYIANRKAASYEVTSSAPNPDGVVGATKVQRFNARGRFFIGLGVALAVWWAIPEVVGRGRSKLAGAARRMLAAAPDDDPEDCGCEG